MAQKRMFDKAVLDTDRFIDLPNTTKAFYFLLGMEADDHGFVSHKKIARLHGFGDDEIKVLIAKNFVISFESGVVVITDWHKHNWLDSRRIRTTEYSNELAKLMLSDEKQYILQKNQKTPINIDAKQSLSNRLDSIEQNSIEQNSIEQNRVEAKSKQLMSQEQEKEMADYFIGKGYDEIMVKNELFKFKLYWTEKNTKGKERWQLQKVFQLKNRLARWFINQDNFKQTNNVLPNNTNIYKI